MNKQNSKFSIWGKVILALLMIACILIDIWFVYLKFWAPERIISQTNKVGEVVLKDGSSKNFFELEYYTNINKNGLEMFEIKINDLMDESRTSFYHHGVQYVANSVEDKIEWIYHVDSQKETEKINSYDGFAIWGTKRWWSKWGYYAPTTSMQMYEYQSGDDFIHTHSAQTKIDKDSMMKITMGEPGSEKVYGLKFKWDKVNAVVSGEYGDSSMALNKAILVMSQIENENMFIFGSSTNYRYYFSYADLNLFAKTMFDSIQNMPAGTVDTIVFKLADLFDFYECKDENAGRYDKIEIVSDLLKKEVENYFGISIKIHADGAKKAQDSMFNCIKGNSNFNLTGDYTSEDYLYGKDVVKCDIYDFDFVNVKDNLYMMKLCQDFKDQYLQYKEVISLSIQVDLDLLKTKNIEFLGFTKDSGLKDFDIFECYTLQTENGELKKVEVTL